MGMFDYLFIDDIHLPKELKGYSEGWQTKSHENLLNDIIIDKDGYLFIEEKPWVNGNDSDEPIKPYRLDYSGEIIFYSQINNIWVEFIALFDDGKMVKLTRKK